MAEILLFGVKLRVDFSFFAVLAVFFSAGGAEYGLLGLAACILHESGHLFVLGIQEHKITQITLYGGGMRICTDKPYNVPALIAGSAGNFLCSVAFLFLPFPQAYLFSVINLIIGLFNLIPIGYLDGRLLFDNMLIKRLPSDKALKIIKTYDKLQIIPTICVFIFLIISANKNPTLYFIFLYMITVDIAEKI